MLDIPDWTPNPATPRGRVAGMLEIPLPPIEPAFGRVLGRHRPAPQTGSPNRDDLVGRSPIAVIPPCCAQRRDREDREDEAQQETPQPVLPVLHRRVPLLASRFGPPRRVP